MKNEEFATALAGLNKYKGNMRNEITKRGKRSMKMTMKLLGAAFFTIHYSFFISCSDILDTESTRQNIEPEILSKTDSVFYGFGILQAMQELADQYVFQGEMRGELVRTTVYTDNNLRQLANFSATTANKYDSAYVYYRVINNCNYYIAHRDTALYTGSTNVAMQEYAAVKAIRAWAYLQLGRNYERVPFFTEPLTQISQIDDNTFPELNLAGIVTQLAPDLEQYTGYTVPNYGQTATGGINIGSPNWESTAKLFNPIYCFIPVDVILGDMYLETGNYDQAARHFVTYLTKVALPSRAYSPYTAPMESKYVNSGRFGMNTDNDLPDNSLISTTVSLTPWNNIFARNQVYDLITMIPMAVNRQNGAVTDVPLTFGFNYYATNEELSANGNTNPYIDEVQLLPSTAMNLLSDSTEYYYYFDNKSSDIYDSIQASTAGDMRMRSIIQQTLVDDSTHQWIDKYKYANIIIYRTSTVLLHLAEAFNRMGMYDAAFAILKDGITDALLERNNDGYYYASYLTDDTRTKLQTTYPLLSDENISRFPKDNACGIHCHGAGKAASDLPNGNRLFGNTYHTGSSPYQLTRMAGLKMEEIARTFNVAVGTTKQDTINAIEDILCDEYALEFAFEGNRFYDLARLARHKNEAGLYSSNFGSLWFARKLAANNPVKDLTDPKNWYLPFK
jgi:hypothetical protein